MRGSPLLRALVLFGALVALAWPLRIVTRQTEVPPDALENAPAASSAPSTEAPSQSVKIPLDVTFSMAAESIEVRNAGRVVWRKERPSLKERVELEMPFPKEGVELGVTVSWAEPQRAAVRLQLSTPEGVELDRSVWGEGKLEAIVPFP